MQSNNKPASQPTNLLTSHLPTTQPKDQLVIQSVKQANNYPTILLSNQPPVSQLASQPTV